MTRPDRAPVAEWRLPEDYPPPRGTKLILLTRQGVAIMGHWSDQDCVAWAPQMQINERVKAKLIKRVEKA